MTDKRILSARDMIRNGNLVEADKLLGELLASMATAEHQTDDLKDIHSNNQSENVSEAHYKNYALLQLGNAKLYLEQYNQLHEIIDKLIVQAKEERDALLSIAALVTKGEAIIDSVTFSVDDSEVQAAIEVFGKALGISEFFDDEKMTILPLAGLAHAHWLWGNPRKATELAERAAARANAVDGDEGEIYKARAALSHAITQQSVETFDKAIEQAQKANHISLKQRIERFYDFYKEELT